MGALAEVALTLDVDRPDQLSLSVALSLLLEKSAAIPRQDLARSEDKRRRQKAQLDIMERMGQARQQLEKEEREVAGSKSQEGAMKKKAAFMREKQRDYARTISKHEQNLSRAGMKSELRHERLQEAAAELRRLERETVAPLRSKLEGFREVPPDLNLAKLKVAEAEAKLEELTSRLTSEIDMLHI